MAGVSWRGVAEGVLALIVLQIVSSSTQATQAGKGLAWIADGVARLVDPEVAGIPDRGATRDEQKQQQAQQK